MDKAGVVPHRCHVPNLIETVTVDPEMKHADFQTDMFPICLYFMLFVQRMLNVGKTWSRKMFVIGLLLFMAFRGTKEAILGMVYDTGDQYCHTPTKFGPIGFS